LKDYAGAVASLLGAYCSRGLPQEELVGALVATGLTRAHATAIVGYGIQQHLLVEHDGAVYLREAHEDRRTPKERRARRQRERTPSRAGASPAEHDAPEAAGSLGATDHADLDVQWSRALVRARSEHARAWRLVADLREQTARALRLYGLLSLPPIPASR
jgi:hypothetical protein